MVKAVWRMSPDNKTESPIDIPLSKQALTLVNELMQNRVDGTEYLLPAMGVRTSKRGHIGEGYLNRVIKNHVIPLMGDIEPFTIHDFRATLKTNLSSKKIGVNGFVSERCLNHKIPGMEGVYDRGDYYPERKEALQLWANFLDTCEKGESWNVIPIKQQAQD